MEKTSMNGLFTFENLYAGRPFDYHQRTTTKISTTIQSSTKLNKIIDFISFPYFYWLLVIVAIVLALTLFIFFICYCHTFLKIIKHNSNSRKTSNRYVRPKKDSQTLAPILTTLPTPECTKNYFHENDTRKLSTFTNCLSNLSSEIDDDVSSNKTKQIEESYESQHASILLDEEKPS